MTGGPVGVLVLVEGESDAAVVRLLSAARGIDARVLPTGGATGTRRALAALERRPAVVLALCDEREAPHVERALTGPRDALFVCRADLEHELLRALGVVAVLEVLAQTGDLGPFRTLQGQPAHRGRPADAQLHRFIAAGSGRKERIDAALAGCLAPLQEPPPLAALLDRLAQRGVGGAEGACPNARARGSDGAPSGS